MTSFEESADVAFQIIASVGAARSCYIEAIHEAKAGNFEAAKSQLDAGAQEFLVGHHAHADLVSQEASGNKTDMCLLLTHAEDQLMSAEAFGILADEFIGVYERIAALEGRSAT